jgi:hypothetical protein
LPILQVPLLETEVVGLALLERVAAAAFAEGDPAEVLFAGRAEEVRRDQSVCLARSSSGRASGRPAERQVSPFVLDLGVSNPLAKWLSVVTGVAAFVLTVLTNHELGIIKVLPFRFHLAARG